MRERTRRQKQTLMDTDESSEDATATTEPPVYNDTGKEPSTTTAEFDGSLEATLVQQPSVAVPQLPPT